MGVESKIFQGRDEARRHARFRRPHHPIKLKILDHAHDHRREAHARGPPLSGDRIALDAKRLEQICHGRAEAVLDEPLELALEEGAKLGVERGVLQ